MRMLHAGLGDMLAKYISIIEWRISHILTGEYYCAAIADLVRDSLRACVDNATVPVLETGTGICHIYVDKDADQEKALNIILEESGRQFDPKLGPLFVQWVQDGTIRPILED